MQMETKNAHSAQEPQKIKNNIDTQLKTFIDNSLQEINEVKFGSLEFEIRDGKVYRLHISKSLLVKGHP